MVLADKKKQENIADYIVYMYQTEDLLRSYDMDPDRIYENIVRHYPVSEDEKNELDQWYREIAQNMKAEGLEKEGHLSFVQDYVNALSQLKTELQDTDPAFDNAYKNAKPFIDQNLEIAGNYITDEVQICLNGIYGYLLLRLQDKSLNNEQQQMVEAFGEVLRVLSEAYKSRNQ